MIYQEPTIYKAPNVYKQAGGGGANEGLLKLGLIYYPYREINGKLWILHNLAWVPDGVTLNPLSWGNTIPAAAVYGGNDNGYYLYGLYYNYMAIDFLNNVLPDGWRVATKNDWDGLFAYLGGGGQASLKLNSEFQPMNGTNTEGFSLYALGVKSGSNMVSSGTYAFYPLSNNGTDAKCYRIGLGTNGISEITRTLSTFGGTVRICKDA